MNLIAAYSSQDESGSENSVELPTKKPMIIEKKLEPEALKKQKPQNTDKPSSAVSKTTAI